MAIKIKVFSEENYKGESEEFWESDENVTHVRFRVASVKVLEGSWELVCHVFEEGECRIKLSDSGGADDDGGYPNLDSTKWNGPAVLTKILLVKGK